MVSPGGILNIWKYKYFKDLPDHCPVHGIHAVDAEIPIERKNWDPAMKILIPEYIQKGHKYRLTFTYYYKDDTCAGMFVVEFKLFQRHGSANEEEKLLVHDVDELKGVLVRDSKDLFKNVDFDKDYDMTISELTVN